MFYNNKLHFTKNPHHFETKDLILYFDEVESDIKDLSVARFGFGVFPKEPSKTSEIQEWLLKNDVEKWEIDQFGVCIVSFINFDSVTGEISFDNGGYEEGYPITNSEFYFFGDGNVTPITCITYSKEDLQAAREFMTSLRESLLKGEIPKEDYVVEDDRYDFETYEDYAAAEKEQSGDEIE